MGRKKNKKKQRGAGSAGTGAEEEAPRLPKAPERISRPFAEALAGVRVPKKRSGASTEKQGARDDARRKRASAKMAAAGVTRGRDTTKAAPTPPEYGYEDRVAYSQTYAGVAPLARRRQGTRLGDPAVVKGGTTGRAPERSDAAPVSVAQEDAARARLAALVSGGIRFHVTREPDGYVEGARHGTPSSMLKALRSPRARPEASLDLHGMQAAEAVRELVRFVRVEQRRGVRLVRVVHGKGLHSEGGIGVLGDQVVVALSSGGAAPFVQAFVSASHKDGGTGALLVQLTR